MEMPAEPPKQTSLATMKLGYFQGHCTPWNRMNVASNHTAFPLHTAESITAW
jgi:hypothetical protein